MHSRHPMPSTSRASSVSAAPVSAASVRPLRVEDQDALLAAFNGCFAASDPGFVARTAAEWRWRFVQNPAGRRATLALDDEGAVLAQYAGLPQRALVEGVAATLTQGIDSFCVPRARALGRRGAFVAAGERFAADYGGAPGAGDPWMWGLPVRAARRIGERALGYVPFRAQVRLELAGPLRASATDLSLREAPWSELDELAPELDGLNARQAERCGAFALRDAPALAWRYAAHPSRRYRLVVATRHNGELAGFAVLGVGRFEDSEGLLWCDGLHDPEAEPALVEFAADLAAREGHARLVALLPPWCESFTSLQGLGFRVRGGRTLWVGRSYTGALPLEFWRERWFYTLGDTDLV